MARTLPPSQARPSAPPEGVLVRVGVEARWTDDIPPVPRGRPVTATLSSARAVARDGAALASLGYTVVGQAEDPAAGRAGAALFFVPRAVAEEHGAWWRALADRADQVLSPHHGPVAALYGAVLSAHLDGAER